MKNNYQVQVSSPYSEGYKDEKGARFDTREDAWKYIEQICGLYPRNHYQVAERYKID